MAEVAVFLPSLQPGGAERAALNLAAGLAARGIAVELLAGNARGAFRALVPPEVRVVDLRAPRTVRALPRLAEYLRVRVPRVLVSALDHANVVALLARQWARVPTRVVVTVHNRLAGIRHRRWLARWAVPALLRVAYPHAEGIVAVSAGVAGDLVRVARLPPERVRVIANPVVGPELYRLAAVPVDHPWLAPGGPPVIAFVGRFVPEKDLPTVVRAFARLRAERHARLVLVGDGPERPRVAALVRALGVERDVWFAGSQVNPYPYMARARVLVLASRSEGLGMVLIEALALGTPVVATDCPSGPAEILAGGRFGRLVPVGDAAALARAVLDTLDHPPDRERLRRAVEPFTVERVLPAYLEVMGLAGGERA